MVEIGDERLPDRFWSKVAVTESGCWQWTGSDNGEKNYGVVSWGGHAKIAYSHRVAYQQLVGPIPDGLVIDHLCRNTRCCNPAHLEAVTQRENIRRGKGDVCIHGHPRTPENVYLYRGKRLCRPCRVRHQKEAADRAKPDRKTFPRGADGRRLAGHCMRGHKLEPPHVAYDNGKPYCMTCKKARQKEREAERDRRRASAESPPDRPS